MRLRPDWVKGHECLTRAKAMVEKAEKVAAVEVEEGDEKDGRGTYRYINGSTYEGEWKGGKYEGRGTFWVLRHWNGTHWNDGDWNDGDADWEVYEGEWKGGKKEGRGTLRYADGDVYEGEWKADKKEGRGTSRYRNGDVYEGEWKADNPEGRGRYQYEFGWEDQAGFVRMGFYKAGKEVGEGVQWSEVGKVYRTRDGKKVEEISLEEARRVLTKHGLPLPEVVELSFELGHRWHPSGAVVS